MISWEQANWASKHDWFVAVRESLIGVGYVVTVRQVKLEGLSIINNELVFTEFDKLMAWATGV